MADIEELIGRLENPFPDTTSMNHACPSCGREYGIRREAAQALRKLRDNWREVVRCSTSAETLASNNAELRAENEKLRAVYEAAKALDYFNQTPRLREAIAAIEDDK